jgi:hypothetical protein
MTKYYDVGHNTAYSRGMPEILKIVRGMVDEGLCPLCGVSQRDPSGDLQVRLGQTRAKLWPDAIACGDYPCFVVSDRFVNAMKGAGVRLELGGTVTFMPPNQSGLSLDGAPQYFWINGIKHRAGKMDFDASGYVDVRFCRHCGVRSDNISLTYKRQHAQPAPPYVIQHDEASGFDLFTTDLSPTAFFCTERVLECAKANRLTNLAFCPVDQGVFGKPVKY